MYTKTAAYYDALYHFKDYKAMSQQIQEFVQVHHGSPKTFLDVACGTGKHLQYLQEYFTVEGLDLNGDLLEIARGRCPEVPFHQGDMSNFDLHKTFDVVGCFFSSVGYVQTKENLNKAVATMAAHLNPGGLLLVEPWFSPENYWVGKIFANYADQPELKIAWMYTSELDGRKSVFDINYMVGTPEGVTTFTEKHVMGLWTVDEYRQAFLQAGIEPNYDEKGFFGRGLYYGKKQA